MRKVIVAMILSLSFVVTSAQTEAISVEFMWTGNRLVLSKAEALRLANNLEDIRNGVGGVTALTNWIPNPVICRIIASIGGLSVWRISTVVSGLRRNCTKKGAILEIGYRNPFGGIMFNTVAKGR